MKTEKTTPPATAEANRNARECPGTFEHCGSPRTTERAVKDAEADESIRIGSTASRCKTCCREIVATLDPDTHLREPVDDPCDNLAVALDALKKGFAAIPVVEGTKIPAIRWKQWQDELPAPELLREWFGGTRRNIAIVCSGLVVFDCDDPDEAELVLAECGDTTHKVATPRGGLHLGYRRRKGVTLLNQVRLKGLPIDIRTDGGLELIPCSATEHGEYRWLGELRPAGELPVARIGWTRERVRKVLRPAERIDDADRMIRRARGYLATIEGAISGQGGHNKTFRVACTLVQKFGLGIDQAWPLFLEWNEQCEPPWSDAELLHKLEDALRLKKE